MYPFKMYITQHTHTLLHTYSIQPHILECVYVAETQNKTYQKKVAITENNKKKTTTFFLQYITWNTLK